MSSTENQDRGPPLRSFLIFLLIISTLSVVVRFWSRAIMPCQSSGGKKSPRFWWDDWMALLCLSANSIKPFTAATTSMGLYLIHLGLGRHFDTIPPAQQTTVLKAFWATYFVYDTAISCAKSSVLFFYARIFASANKRFMYTILAAQIVVFLWLFSILMMVLFTCVPVQKSWQPEIKGTCLNTNATFLGSAISNIIIDFFILLLPMPILWRLQMRRLQKTLVTGVFVCGYGVIAISMGRLVTVIKAGSGLQDDLTWNIVTPVYWLGAEGPVSLVSICLPSIFFFARRAMREGPSSLFNTHTNSGARLMSATRESERLATHQEVYGNCSIELKQSSNLGSHQNMPDLADRRNYQAMAVKGSASSTYSSDEVGIHVKKEVNVSNRSAV
ncbi:hypothetical protein BOTCAL_0048g00140 [Botryotinia calthae]|uniref:Rhodopsin domain-containing protein n=1 Tax=Botryotinia calthae TaxID=38488 RepID=A0A4Y8DBM3_9HELO|nr:hypothetical protein BOTCAL_0048g00140 [Botryotinia calthae]